MANKFEGKKHYVHSLGGSQYETRDEAEKEAKRTLERNNKSGYPYTGATIYEAVAYVATPVPAYEVTEIK